MATLLQVTNFVLKRLREDTVADLTDDYAELIASFVADIAEDVNEAWAWSSLDHTIEFDLVADQRVYDLSATTSEDGDVINGLRTTNEESVLLYDPDGRPQAWSFDDDADRYGQYLCHVEESTLERIFQQDRALTQQDPYWFTLRMNDTFDGLEFLVYPLPTESRRIRIRFNTPELPLDPETDANTEILVPNRVVRLGALFLALNERGEEIGEPGNIAETRYLRALSAATENEIRNAERTGKFDFSRN